MHVMHVRRKQVRAGRCGSVWGRCAGISLAARARRMVALAWAAASLCVAAAGASPLPAAGGGDGLGAEVTGYAAALAGRPYRAGGTTPERGFDCSGFVQHVFATAAQVELPRRTRDMATQGRKVALAELEPGDLVFYNTLGARYSHVGIYLGDGQFVHSPSRGGSVGMADMRNRYWVQRYSGARRVLDPSGAMAVGGQHMATRATGQVAMQPREGTPARAPGAGERVAAAGVAAASSPHAVAQKSVAPRQPAVVGGQDPVLLEPPMLLLAPGAVVLQVGPVYVLQAADVAMDDDGGERRGRHARSRQRGRWRREHRQDDD